MIGNVEREQLVRIQTQIVGVRSNQAAQKRFGGQVGVIALLQCLDDRGADARFHFDLKRRDAAPFARLT